MSNIKWTCSNSILIGFIGILQSLLFVGHSFGQSDYFNKTIDGPLANTEFATSIIEIDGLGFFMAGIGDMDLGPPWHYTFFLMTDYNGDSLWSKAIIDTFVHFIPIMNSLINTSDGNLAFTGYMNFTNPLGGGTDSTYAALVKLNYQGDTLWTKLYKYDDNNLNWFWDCKETPDHGFIMVGFTYDIDSTKNDLYLVKTDSVGNVEWEKVFGNEDDDLGFRILIGQDNGYLLSGEKSIYVGGPVGYHQKLLLMYLDSSGTKQWIKYFDYFCYGGTTTNYMHRTRDGNYIVTGAFSPAGYKDDPDSINCTAKAIKFDKSGSVIWNKFYIDTISYFVDIFNDSFVRAGSSIGGTTIGLKDGSFVSIGNTYYGNSAGVYPFGWLVKIDQNGQLLWKRRFYYSDPSREDNYFYDMKPTPDGGFIICGSASENTLGLGGHDIWLVKVDSFGCEVPGCQAVGISPVQNNDYVITKAYPNPFNNNITIYVECGSCIKSVNLKLKLYDVIGREITPINYSTQLFSISNTSRIFELRVNGNNFNSGVIFYRILSDNIQIAVGKIIAQ